MRRGREGKGGREGKEVKVNATLSEALLLLDSRSLYVKCNHPHVLEVFLRGDPLIRDQTSHERVLPSGSSSIRGRGCGLRLGLCRHGMVHTRS